MKKILCIILVLLLCIGIYGYFINPKSLKVVENTITIEDLPDSFKDFKIVQFSDILLNTNESVTNLDKVVDKINELKPDIIVFTGDLLNNNYNLSNDEILKVKETLSKLECNLYKYAIMGDNDKKQIELFQDIMKETDFKILDNESIYLFYKDNTPIKITGITNLDDVNKALEITDNLEVSYNLVLTHYPDYFDELMNYDIDTILAGHSLKGQIRIPFYGGIIKKDNAYKYLDGYYSKNDTTMYVSSGIGNESINYRLFNKPEINLYRLAKSD